MRQFPWGTIMVDSTPAGVARIPVSMMLPTNLAVGILCAVASAGAVWGVLGRQVSDNGLAVSEIRQRLAVVESDNRDQKNYIDQMQKQMAEVGTLNAATALQLTQIQISIAKLQVTVENIYAAGTVHLPGDRKPPPP